MIREKLETKDDLAVKKGNEAKLTSGNQNSRSTTFHASKNFRQALKQKMDEAEKEEQKKMEASTKASSKEMTLKEKRLAEINNTF